MSDTTGYTLLPCPFCGHTELWFDERAKDGILNKLGRVQRRMKLDVAVTCTGCGAEGPRESYFGDEVVVTDHLVRNHKAAATLAWNGRDAAAKSIVGVIQSIAEKAIKQINEQ